MKEFFKMFFAALLAGVVLTFLPFFMLMGMMSVLTALTEEKAAEISDESYLVINTATPIMDCVVEDPMSKYSSLAALTGDVPDPVGLKDLTDAIARAKDDDRIKGIVLEGEGFGGGMAQLVAVREALEDFKTSGKYIVSYANLYSQGDYILKSVGDKIFLNPNGSVDLKGLSVLYTFYKGFEEKYGIDVQIFRVGKFKSAVEPFMNEKMSPENREQNRKMITTIWDTLSLSAAQGRGMSHAAFCVAAANRVGISAAGAYQAGLVDSLLYKEDFKAYVKDSLKTKNKVSYRDYAKEPVIDMDLASKKVAVIYAEGEIVYGKGVSGQISENGVRKDVENVLKDTNVVAVVMRVNSPGGSALVSDNIWKMVENIKKEKPVVVSMGDYAASGGYYISCGADYIYAEPTTLTGSIGVFGMIPNAQKLAKSHGITTDEVSIYPNSADPSLITPVSSSLSPIIQKSVEDTYSQFLSRVAEGRDMTVDAVHEIAQGRVWTGADALDLGLVDAMGGIYDAVEKAAELAGVDDYRVIQVTKTKTSMESLMEMINGAKDDELESLLGVQTAQVIKTLRDVSEGKEPRVMARMPYGYRVNF